MTTPPSLRLVPRILSTSGASGVERGPDVFPGFGIHRDPRLVGLPALLENPRGADVVGNPIDHHLAAGSIEALDRPRADVEVLESREGDRDRVADPQD